MYTPYIQAYRYLDAYQIGLLTLTASLYVCLINDFFKKKINASSYIYALLSIIGSYIILYKNHSWNLTIKGVLLVESASLCFAYAQISYKNLKETSPELKDSQAFSYIHLTSFIVASILCFIFSDPSTITQITHKEWFTLLYLGVMATGVAFYLWNKGCVKASIESIALCNNLKVPIIAILSYYFFNEQESLLQLIFGSLLILLALLFAERKKQELAPKTT